MKTISLEDKVAQKLADVLHDEFDDIRRSRRDNLRNEDDDDAAEELEAMEAIDEAHKQLSGESLFEEFGDDDDEDEDDDDA